jgi:hypothetical protein
VISSPEKKAVASGEWLVATNFWISWYWGLGAVGNWALGDVQKTAKAGFTLVAARATFYSRNRRPGSARRKGP